MPEDHKWKGGADVLSGAAFFVTAPILIRAF